jgi:hypothetical protein
MWSGLVPKWREPLNVFLFFFCFDVRYALLQVACNTMLPAT